MPVFRRVVLSCLALASVAIVPACTAEGGNAETADDDIAVSARCDRDIGAKIRAKVATAREKIAKLDTPFAREVEADLDAGRVRLLPFCAMTRLEYGELEKGGSDLPSLGGTQDERYQRLRRAEAPIMKQVHAEVYGFQWENRIYLSTGMSDSRMVETIAHEVRHVRRQAHLRNYDDQRVVCVEELEAFKAEVEVRRALRGPQEIIDLRKKVNDIYELDKLRDESCTYK
jgi:hypothetical protein